MSGQISVGRTSANFQNRFARLSPVFDCAKSAFKILKNPQSPRRKLLKKERLSASTPAGQPFCGTLNPIF
jgi:hypothetical protein